MTQIKKAKKRDNVAKPDTPSELRRTLLKTGWMVPVITVVGLPAHAQTSSPATTTPCPQLVVPGRTEICEDPPTLSADYYIIDDETDTCPALVVGQEGSPFSFWIGFSYAAPIITISISSGSVSRSFAINCTSPSPFTPPPQTLDIEAMSGVPWIAEFTFSRDNTSVSISDIILTPK